MPPFAGSGYLLPDKQLPCPLNRFFLRWCIDPQTVLQLPKRDPVVGHELFSKGLKSGAPRTCASLIGKHQFLSQLHTWDSKPHRPAKLSDIGRSKLRNRFVDRESSFDCSAGIRNVLYLHPIQPPLVFVTLSQIFFQCFLRPENTGKTLAK